MSWLSKNYDKVALATAGLVAFAVGYSVISGSNEVVTSNRAKANNSTEIKQREDLVETIKKFNNEYKFDGKSLNGIEIRSFVSFPLYSIKGEEELRSLKDDYEIHPGMKLGWWKKYDLKDYTQLDGPDLDPDKDGFTNREEFDGKTNPKDDKDHPNLIAKLQCNGASAKKYQMNWTKQDAKIGLFSLKYAGKRLFYGPLGAGDKFPKRAKNKLLLNRFEVIKKDQDADKPREESEYYLLQDNGENQNKKQFKLYYRQKTEFKDWTATFLLGIEGSIPFNVHEGGFFSLPYDNEAKIKPYKFKSKKGNKAEIEFDDKGKKSTFELLIPPPK